MAVHRLGYTGGGYDCRGEKYRFRYRKRAQVLDYGSTLGARLYVLRVNGRRETDESGTQWGPMYIRKLPMNPTANVMADARPRNRAATGQIGMNLCTHLRTKTSILGSPEVILPPLGFILVASCSPGAPKGGPRRTKSSFRDFCPLPLNTHFDTFSHKT